MKRFATIILPFVLFFSVLGCKKNNGNGTPVTATLEVFAEVPYHGAGITYLPTGELIISTHDFFAEPVRVYKYDPTTKTSTPYPNESWNTPNDNNEDAYISGVLGLRTDTDGIVWMLDMGLRNTITPKFVGWNSKTNAVEKIIKIPAPYSNQASQLNDFAINTKNGKFIIADEGIGNGGDGSTAALVIVDKNTGAMRRVLEGHKTTRPENIPIVVDGISLNDGSGNPILVGADGITIDKNEEWIYYAPLNGHSVYRVKTEDLLNTSLSNEALGNRVETYATKELNGGLTIDEDNNLYLSNVTSNSIGIIPSTTKTHHQYAVDSKMIWPDGISYNAHDGYMYSASNQLPLGAAFNKGVDKTQSPFRIYRVKPIAKGLPQR